MILPVRIWALDKLWAWKARSQDGLNQFKSTIEKLKIEPSLIDCV